MGIRVNKPDGFKVVRALGIDRDPTMRPRTRTVAVVSGKGGVGKTTMVTNLALACHRAGRQVLVVDGDLGMANVDLLLGLVPARTLHNVVLGECAPAEILIRSPEGIHVMPGASGVEEMADLDDLRCERLLRSVADVEAGMDLILIDTAPGIHRGTIHLARAADEILIVTTPEPTAWTDAYAVLRVLHKGRRPAESWIVVNQARDSYEARAAAERIQSTAKRFLGIEPRYLGTVLDDPFVGSAVRRQEPLLRLFPHSTASACIERIALRLVEGSEPSPEDADVPEAPRKVANLDREDGLFRAKQADGPGAAPSPIWDRDESRHPTSTGRGTTHPSQGEAAARRPCRAGHGARA